MPTLWKNLPDIITTSIMYPNKLQNSVPGQQKQSDLNLGDEIMQIHGDPATSHRSEGAGLIVVMK